MVQTLDIGMGDYRACAGEHICAVYSTSAERDALLGSYVRSALRSPDRCICVLDSREATQMTQIVANVGADDEIDLPTCLASGQLELVGASETTVPWGRLADKIGFWKGAIAGSMNAGKYQCIRAIGEMSSSMRDVPRAREVLDFESELNELLPLYPQIVVCMYNLNKVDGAFLVDVVSMHPKVFVRGTVVDNPYYLSPKEWLNTIGT
jgi:hypothetical protein